MILAISLNLDKLWLSLVRKKVAESYFMQKVSSKEWLFLKGQNYLEYLLQVNQFENPYLPFLINSCNHHSIKYHKNKSDSWQYPFTMQK